MALIRLRQNIDDYVQDKNWYWYVPFWIFGLYLFIRLLSFKLGEAAPSFFISIAQSFDFVLHEMAHLLTAFLPPIMTAAAGSFSELLLGSALIITAFAVRSYFASLFCFLWFMLATQATADYMADARSQSMPLVTFGGGDPIHDWHFIFDKLGLLQHDTLIAGIVRGFGIGLAVCSLIFSAWLITRMIGARQAQNEKQRHEKLLNKLAAKSPKDRPDQPFVGGDLYPTPTTGTLADRHPAPDQPDKPKIPPAPSS